jgi:hypothetical protein
MHGGLPWPLCYRRRFAAVKFTLQKHAGATIDVRDKKSSLVPVLWIIRCSQVNANFSDNASVMLQPLSDAL